MKIKVWISIILAGSFLALPALSSATTADDLTALLKQVIQASVSKEKNGPVSNYAPDAKDVEIYRIRFENNSSFVLSSPVFSVYTSDSAKDKVPFTNFKYFLNGNPVAATPSFPVPTAQEKTSIDDIFGTDAYYHTGSMQFDSTVSLQPNSWGEFIIKADLSADDGSKILFGIYAWSFLNQTSQTLVVTPLKYGPINAGNVATTPPPPANPTATFSDGILVQDGSTIYVIEYGQKRAIASMDVFRKLGYKLANVVPGDTSGYTKADDIVSADIRHPRGSLIVDRQGTVYFLGKDIRYPFTSAEVFLSWGNKFENVVPANDWDLQSAIGPVAEMKPASL